MKLVTYSELPNSTKTHTGMVWGNWLLELGEIPKIASDLGISISKQAKKTSDEATNVLELISNRPRALDDLQNLSWRFFNRIDPRKVPRTLRKVTDVKLHPPIPRPHILRDFYAFEDHVKAARARRGLPMPQEWYEFPAFYYANPNTILGPDYDLPYPSYTKSLDFELEIACVLGSMGKNVPEKAAEALIAGYMIMNDWSARDIQAKEMKIGLGPAKAKDFATSMGPWLVTPDELQDRRTGGGRFDLEMNARVNGKPLSKGNMKNMHWTFSQMIARASEGVELAPGEVFGSGTVGTGSILELGPDVHRFLKPGDRVELEIERLGVLRNRIIRS